MTAPANPTEVGKRAALAALHFIQHALREIDLLGPKAEGVAVNNISYYLECATKALSAPSPPIGDTGGVGEDGELQTLAEQSAENMRLIDWIADRIGLPHDEELSRSNFDTFLAALVPARVEAVDHIVPGKWCRRSSTP